MKFLTNLSESGIDVDKGLFCCSDDMDLYMELLKIYRDEKQDVISRLNNEFEKGEIGAVKELAHALKGVSGTIGGTEIYDVAGALESACLEGDDSEKIGNLIVVLGWKLSPVMEVLANYEEMSDQV